MRRYKSMKIMDEGIGPQMAQIMEWVEHTDCTYDELIKYIIYQYKCLEEV